MGLSGAMATGVSGLLTQAEGINVIGNNIANVNTTGFKGSRMLFSDMLSTPAVNSSQIGRGVQIQTVDNLFGSGPFAPSTNVTDVALQGNSFFALGSPGGNANVAAQSSAYLSKAGSFSVDSTRYLVNPDGYQVLDTAGNPIRFTDSGTTPPTAGDFSQITKIDSNGAITYQDKLGNSYYYLNAATTGTATFTANTNLVIAIVTPTDQSGLEKVGGSLYKAGDSGVPAVAFSNAAGSVNIANGTSQKLLSNYLEQSNVDMASEFVNLIMTQRAYSANSKTITTADEMTQEVLNLKR